MSEHMGTSQYLSLKAAARVANLGYMTLWRMVNEGRGPPIHNLNPTAKKPLIRIHEDDLKSWLDSCRRT